MLYGLKEVLALSYSWLLLALALTILAIMAFVNVILAIMAFAIVILAFMSCFECYRTFHLKILKNAPCYCKFNKKDNTNLINLFIYHCNMPT